VKKPKKRKAPAKAKNKSAKTDRDLIDAKRAKAYSDMESHVCDLARTASLAMAVIEDAELFLFAVGQLDAMTERSASAVYRLRILTPPYCLI
jgi:hypothetical protein